MIAVVLNPQHSGGYVQRFEDVDAMMRKAKLNRIDEETRALIDKAARRGDIVYVTHNPYQSEMSFAEAVPTHEVMADTDKTRLIERFYQLRAEI